MNKENRITIFTKSSSSSYGGRALVLDLTRRLNHIHSASVAKHPIEGAGHNKSDHAFLNNTVVEVSGHITNAVSPPPQTLNLFSYDPYGVYRDQDAYLNSLEEENKQMLEDFQIFSTRTEIPITQEELDIINKYSLDPVDLEVGDDLPIELDEFINSEITRQTQALNDKIDQRISTKEPKAKTFNNSNLRPLYHTDQASKQLDAFEFLEAIRDERLLCDVLTTTKLYENMFMSSLSLPREIGQGCALEIRIRFEQQRFTETSRSKLAFRFGDIIEQSNKGKDQGRKSSAAEEAQVQESLRAQNAFLKIKESIDRVSEAAINN